MKLSCLFVGGKADGRLELCDSAFIGDRKIVYVACPPKELSVFANAEEEDPCKPWSHLNIERYEIKYKTDHIVIYGLLNEHPYAVLHRLASSYVKHLRSKK